jgi:ATP-dependent RNA helicase TDRD9
VEGFTGCGKTTQVPQFILDNAIEHGHKIRIAVTQPRRIAAISVAQRVCEERGWPVGSLVGYQVCFLLFSDFLLLTLKMIFFKYRWGWTES